MSIIKKILHQKFTLGELTYETINQYHRWLKDVVHNELNDEYVVITTPTNIESLNYNDVIIKIDAKQYTLKELLDTIEKAVQYDDLCR